MIVMNGAASDVCLRASPILEPISNIDPGHLACINLERLMLNFAPIGHLRRLAPALAFAASTLIGSTAWAQTQEQVPGYYRKAVGDSVVTAIYDGYIDLNPGHLKGLTPKEVQTLVAREFQAKEQLIQTAVNAYVVQMGKKLILIDSGSSDCFGPTMGRMVDNIRAAGFQPEDIQDVLLTHMHPDHACGVTLPNGKAAFPNATVWAERKDAAYWLDDKTVARLPKGQGEFVAMAQKAIAPYASKGQFKTFSAGEQLLPGVRALASHGHTPGHTSYVLTSGAETLLLWGDIVHFHAVQLPHPEVTIEVDVDPAKAVQSRQNILALAAKNRWWVAAAHHPFPGIGHIRQEAVGYSWVPVEYGPVRRSDVK